MFSNNDDMESSSQLRTVESEDVGSKQDEFYSKFGSRAAAAIRRATISDTIRKAKEDHKKTASPLTDPGESGNTTVTKPFRNTNSSSEDERVPPPSSGPGMKNGLPLYPPPRQRRRGPLHQANRVFRPRPSPERIQLNHQNFNHRTFREERNTQNRPPRRACNRGRKNRRHYRSEPRVITYNYNFGDPSIFLPLMNHTGGRLDQLPFFQQPVSLMNLPMYGHMKQYGHSSALAPCYPPKPVSVAPVNNVTKTAPVRKIIEMHPEITQDSYASVSDDDDVMIIEDNIPLEKSFANVSLGNQPPAANVSLGNQPPVLQSNAPNSTFREIVCIDLSDSE